jgi:hypothetical protein
MQFVTVALGLGSGLSAALIAARVAAAADRRPAAAFGIAAFFIAGLVYVTALQLGTLRAHPSALMPASLGPEAAFLVYAGATALLAVTAAAGIVGGWVLVMRRGQAAGRFKTFGLAVLFSLALCILSAPFLIQNQLLITRAVRANEAEIKAFTASYTAGLEKLVKWGALSRIEIGDEAITHFIGGPLYRVGPEGLAEYARAAMVYHTLVLGQAPKPVILRDADSGARVATYQPGGHFFVEPKRDLSQAEPHR